MNFYYSPIGDWSSKHTSAEQAIIASTLAAPPADDPPANGALGWMRLITRLPPAFRSALHAELVAGNAISGIDTSDWPAHGSIIVYMLGTVLGSMKREQVRQLFREASSHKWRLRTYSIVSLPRSISLTDMSPTSTTCPVQESLP